MHRRAFAKLELSFARMSARHSNTFLQISAEIMSCCWCRCRLLAVLGPRTHMQVKNCCHTPGWLAGCCWCLPAVAFLFSFAYPTCLPRAAAAVAVAAAAAAMVCCRAALRASLSCAASTMQRASSCSGAQMRGRSVLRYAAANSSS
jgi:hypothetical protein